MATSPRRRKPAEAGAPVPVPDTTADTTAAAPDAAPVDAEPAAPPPAKRPRAPRKRADAPPTTTDAVVAEVPAAPKPRARRPRAAAALSEAVAEARAPVEETTPVVPSDEPAPDLPAVPEVAPTVEAVEAVEAVEETPPPPPPPEPPPRPPASRLGLHDDGLQRGLRWQTGARCPDTLAQALRRWHLAELDGPLPLTHHDDLAELLAIAARTGHPVDVEPAVWQHLARLGDLQGRIAHLESRHPQGLDPAAQPDGSLLAGWRACQLEAAFFAACVGRCVLADEPALQPEAELLLAARLVVQHFGAAAPVVVAPGATHDAWRAAWRRTAPSGTYAPISDDRELTLLTPDQPVPDGTELLLLDQRGGLHAAAAESPAPWLWVLAPADVLDQPEALPLLAAVDQLRQGGLAAWHARGDASALAPLLLARRFADVAAQWPAWAPTVRTTPALAGEAPPIAALAQRLARWQRSGYLADSDQLALRHGLQAAWAGARATNTAALPGLLREALDHGAGRIVVFSEDAATLPTLAEALQAEGLPAAALPTGGARQADPALRAFRDAPEPRILLVADGAEGADVDAPRIGVQLASPLVIHLDTPWAAGALDRRLQRVRPGAAQRQVPVWQLLPDGSLMAAHAECVQGLGADVGRLDGALLRGPALAAWQTALTALLAGAPPA